MRGQAIGVRGPDAGLHTQVFAFRAGVLTRRVPQCARGDEAGRGAVSRVKREMQEEKSWQGTAWMQRVGGISTLGPSGEDPAFGPKPES